MDYDVIEVAQDVLGLQNVCILTGEIIAENSSDHESCGTFNVEVFKQDGNSIILYEVLPFYNCQNRRPIPPASGLELEFPFADPGGQQLELDVGDQVYILQYEQEDPQGNPITKHRILGPILGAQDLKKCKFNVYLRVTINGNKLVRGGEQFSIKTKNIDGDDFETEKRAVWGSNSANDDEHRFYYAGPFDLTDWDFSSDLEIRLHRQRHMPAFNQSGLPTSINGYQVVANAPPRDFLWPSTALLPDEAGGFSHFKWESLTQAADYIYVAGQENGQPANIRMPGNKWGMVSLTRCNGIAISDIPQNNSWEASGGGYYYVNCIRFQPISSTKCVKADFIYALVSASDFLSSLVVEDYVYNHYANKWVKYPIVCTMNLDLEWFLLGYYEYIYGQRYYDCFDTDVDPANPYISCFFVNRPNNAERPVQRPVEYKKVLADLISTPKLHEMTPVDPFAFPDRAQVAIDALNSGVRVDRDHFWDVANYFHGYLICGKASPHYNNYVYCDSPSSPGPTEHPWPVLFDGRSWNAYSLKIIDGNSFSLFDMPLELVPLFDIVSGSFNAQIGFKKEFNFQEGHPTNIVLYEYKSSTSDPCPDDPNDYEYANPQVYNLPGWTIKFSFEILEFPVDFL